MAGEVKSRCCTEAGGKLLIRIDALPATQRGFWLYELLQGYGFAGSVVENIAQALEKISGKRFHSSTHTLIKDRDLLIVSPRKSGEAQDSVSIAQAEVEGGVQVPLAIGGALQLRVVSRSEVDFSQGSRVAFLSYSALQFPLTLRPWHSGDSFVPLGMSGEKKLSDFFIDIKLNLTEKSEQLLLCSGNGNVAWVLGRRLDNRYRVTPEAQKILKAEVVTCNQ
jgi:tRNA(Ile)-lysidine synthase